jgi:hypothetical protein
VTQHPILVALAVALLAGCGAAGQSAQPSASEGTQTQTAEPTRTPSPTAEPTPNSTAAGELVLQVTYQSFGSYWRSISLVADGRMTFPSESGWKVRVLSPSGVDRVRMEAIGTGLFAETADYPLPAPNQDNINCPESGLAFIPSTAIELVTDDGPVIVSWQRASGFDGCWEPNIARDALESLLAKLESPVDWLPADAWQDPTLRPYESHSYRLITIAQPRLQDVGDVAEASSVSWPLADSLTTFGEAFTPRVYAESWTVRCGVVSPDEAELVTDALTDAGATMTDSSPSGFASVTLLGDRPRNEMVAVILEALPVGMNGCAQLELEFLNCWQVGAIQPFYCAVP